MDVPDPDPVPATVKRAHDEFDRIDILVNHAAGTFLCPAEKPSGNGWNNVRASVPDGTFYGSHWVGAGRIERKFGNLMNLGAVTA